jgi:hypothetical protein
MSKGENMAAGEYTGLDGRSVVERPTPDSDALRRDGLLLAAGIFPIAIGMWYIMLGGFYLPPEAGPYGGGCITIAGAAFIGVGAAALAALNYRPPLPWCPSSPTVSS